MKMCWRVHVWKKDNHIIIIGSLWSMYDFIFSLTRAYFTQNILLKIKKRYLKDRYLVHGNSFLLLTNWCFYRVQWWHISQNEILLCELDHVFFFYIYLKRLSGDSGNEAFSGKSNPRLTYIQKKKQNYVMYYNKE